MIFLSSELFNAAKKHIQHDDFIPSIESNIRDLIIFLFKQCTQNRIRNYTQQQLIDISNELHRLRCLINYFILHNVCSRSGIPANKNNELIDMKNLTQKFESFSKQDRKRFDDALKKCFRLNEKFILRYSR